MVVSMKKRMLKIVLGFSYVILVTMLLLIQVRSTTDAAQRWIACGEILLLGIPLVVVFILYMRVIGQVENRNGVQKTSASATDAGDGNVTTDTFVGTERSEPLSYEQQYAHFLEVVQSIDEKLSERELEVAWLLYRGYTNRQIGEELYIAETTVKKHVSHIYEKLNVGSRKEFKVMIQKEDTV